MVEGLRLVIFGPPGSGKGTLSKMIVSKYGLVHLSTGDMFRNSRGPEGEAAKKLMAQGRYVPDELTNPMLRKAVLAVDPKRGFILDGYPRTLPQAEFLKTVTQIDAVILLTVKPDLLIDRLTGRRTCPNCGAIYNVLLKPTKVQGVCDNCGTLLQQRRDDDPLTVKTRIETYHDVTKPVVEHYLKEGSVIEIDGSGTDVAVFNEFVRRVKDIRRG